MATLLLVREASLPSGAVAAAARYRGKLPQAPPLCKRHRQCNLERACNLDRRFDGTHAVGACTAGGHLLYLPARPADARTPAGSSFSILLQHPAEAEAQPLEKLVRPWALLAFLPRGEGVLFAQEGSRKLLFAPLPAEPGAGSSSSVFLFGSHEGELRLLPLPLLLLSPPCFGCCYCPPSLHLSSSCLHASPPGGHASSRLPAQPTCPAWQSAPLESSPCLVTAQGS